MSEAPSNAYFNDRQTRLAGKLQETDLDAVALNAGPSLTYLTGLHFHLSERPILGLFTATSPPVIILPELEAGKLSDLPYQVEAFSYGEDPGTWKGVFQAGLQAARLPGNRIGLEPRQIRVLELDLLRAANPIAEFTAGDASIAELRIRKDQLELANMRQAVQVAQNALASILPKIQPGVNERELAAEMTIAILRAGSQSQLPFQPIIASGPNSANPHAFASERRFENGDMLIIDWGASIGGYFSDLTRTFTIGEPEDEMKQIAEVVLAANRSAFDQAGPGVPAEQVDHAAREVIEAAGYGQYFIHRTGHGLGMEGHEAPYIRDGNKLRLTPGMTFTIEPGIYIPGRGGVRIEDDAVITDNGCESLSDLQRELLVLGL
jgi:Xaa-Pro dipeptidase